MKVTNVNGRKLYEPQGPKDVAELNRMAKAGEIDTGHEWEAYLAKWRDWKPASGQSPVR